MANIPQAILDSVDAPCIRGGFPYDVGIYARPSIETRVNEKDIKGSEYSNFMLIGREGLGFYQYGVLTQSLSAMQLVEVLARIILLNK